MERVLIALSIAALWAIAFTSWRLRNWRATAFLAFGSVAILAAGRLPTPAAPLVQGALWVVFALLVLFRTDRLSTVAEPEALFIECYAAVLRRLADLKGQVRTSEPAAYVAEFEGLIEELEAIEAPTPEWADLRTGTAQELRRRLVLMRLGTRPSPQVLDRANEAWWTIEQRFEQMLKARRRFWAGWPRLV